MIYIGPVNFPVKVTTRCGKPIFHRTSEFNKPHKQGISQTPALIKCQNNRHTRLHRQQTPNGLQHKPLLHIQPHLGQTEDVNNAHNLCPIPLTIITMPFVSISTPMPTVPSQPYAPYSLDYCFCYYLYDHTPLTTMPLFHNNCFYPYALMPLVSYSFAHAQHVSQVTFFPLFLFLCHQLFHSHMLPS